MSTKDAHNRDEDAKNLVRWIQGQTWKDRIRNEKFRSDAMVKPITTYVTQKRLSWYGHVMRRDDKNVAKQVNDEGGREETSRKAQTEVDGQSAEQYQRTPARSKARK